VAIGSVNDSITPGALLDLSQATDAGGLLLPQIVSTDTATAVLKKPGMLVYNKTDGKIYAYNGSAWSAGGGSGGSGGGGGEPEPTPSPTSCSGSVMGVSGTVYPIGSYPYAQNNLKNLCWTLSNLLEAGASYTSYTGQDELRGYYYGAGVASNPETDICKESLGSAWRVPNAADWGLLKDGIADLTSPEAINWVGEPYALAGCVVRNNRLPSGRCDVGWGEWSDWWIGGTDGIARLYYDLPNVNSLLLPQFVNTGSDYKPDCSGGWINFPYTSVRCVRDL
jgi:hypothetical protein